MANSEVYYRGPIITRAQAKAQGLKFYFTGEPCKNGHIALRYTSSSCIICSEKQRTQWHKDNLERHRKLQAQWYRENKDHHYKYGRQWRKENPERTAALTRRYRQRHSDKVRNYKKSYYHNVEKNNAKNVLCMKIRGLINPRLKGRTKDKQLPILPYTIEDLRRRLISTLPPEYSWTDFLEGRLQIDHIIPVSAFNFDSPNDPDFMRCWDLNNLRLLHADENCRKNNRIDVPFQPSLKEV